MTTLRRPSSPSTILSSRYRWLIFHPEWINSLLVIVTVIIIYEVLDILPLGYDLLVQLTLGFVLIFSVIFVALCYSLYPALVTALLANLYIIYAFSGPGRHVQSLSAMLRGEWLLILVFFGPALIIGFLRRRIDILIGQERRARAMAEREQRRLQAILEQLPVGVLIAENTQSLDKHIYRNQWLTTLLGSTSNQERSQLIDNAQSGNSHLQATGKTQAWEDIKNGPLQQVLQGQILTSQEFIYAQGKRELVMRINGAPIYDSEHRLTSGVVMFDDITKEKELEQRKDDFVSMVSHELKTPLTSLKMYLQLTRKYLTESSYQDARNALTKAMSQSDKLNHLISDMLALTQEGLDRLAYSYQRVNLSQLISAVVEDIQPVYPSHNLHVKCPPLVWVEADPNFLSQAILNIIINAIKYSPMANSVCITVEQQANQALVSVQDFGIGIDEAEQERIFDRFYQAPQNNTQDIQGAGIGLYLSIEIVKRHHGHLWVSSHPNQGSTFFISLPVTSAPNHADSKPPL